MIEIHLENIEKKVHFDDSRKVKASLFYGLDYTFRKNHLYAVYGEPDSGKTMLVRLLLRLNDPDKGGVFLNGVPAHDYPWNEYRLYFSAALQPNHFFTESVDEEIAYTAQFHLNIPRSNQKSRIYTVATMMQLPRSLKDTPPWQLSRADQAKVKMARALFGNADGLIMDGTLDELPQDEAEAILDHLKSLCRQEEKVVIFTTRQKELQAKADHSLPLQKIENQM